MLLKPLFDRIYYVDVVALLIGAMLVAGRLIIPPAVTVSGLLRDVPGWWMPLTAVALLVGLRRRAYTQETPWIVGTCMALAFASVVALFWRSTIPVFLAAVLTASVMLLAGLVLRTRRVSEPLLRTDWFGLAAMASGMALTLVLTEAVVRLVPGLFDQETQQLLRRGDRSRYGVAHPYIGHLHTPNNTFVLAGRDFHATHHVDGLGFRNPWPWPEQADLVTVGDSVTFGQGVEDSQAWPFLVAQRFSPRRLVNLGLIGAGPQQYLRVFETFGVKLRPKLLVVGVFARNDFWDADIFDRWLASGAGGNYIVWRDFGRASSAPFRPTRPLRSLERLARARVVPLLRSSYLYNLVVARRGGVEGEPPPPPRIFSFADGSRLQLLEQDFLSTSAGARPGRREFALVVDALQQLHALAAREGARVLMVLQPGKEEVYLPLLEETTIDPTMALRAALDERGIEYLDLAPGFRARAAAGERLFFEADGHPNPRGYALIAELVAAHLKEHAQRYGLAN